VAERFIGTLRRDCLDHPIILDEQHLRSVLTEFVQYDNLGRPHRTLHLQTPVPALRSVEGSVRSRPVLGVCITCTSEQPDRRPIFAP
jgi:hypothetical protein